MDIVGRLLVFCTVCNSEVQVKQLFQKNAAHIFSKTTIGDIFSQQSTSMPSPAVQRAAGTLIKRMLSDDGLMQVPTGSHGQVCSNILPIFT